VAGGTSQGVLLEGQLELNSNYQQIRSDKFFTGDKPAERKYFDRFSSDYQYFRVAYGLSDRLTLSVEGGNYFHKEETGLNGDAARTYDSRGISDLVIFPRFTVMNLVKPKHTTELSLGMGVKVPLGSYNDSTEYVEPFSGFTYYVTNPQAVQLTSGALDAIFYAFLYRGYPSKGFRTFANLLYIRKSWNPLGERMGDFVSIGLFAGKTFFYRYGLTLQLRGEWMGKMQINPDILMYAFPNYDPEATGHRKLFLSPQFSYSYEALTVYALVDIPLYQYVNLTQVGTQWQATAGVSYKLRLKE
jgi:hypothetical protein